MPLDFNQIQQAGYEFLPQEDRVQLLHVAHRMNSEGTTPKIVRAADGDVYVLGRRVAPYTHLLMILRDGDAIFDGLYKFRSYFPSKANVSYDDPFRDLEMEYTSRVRRESD